jgi:hypothetical protein
MADHTAAAVMEELDALQQPLPTDQFILLMTSIMRESMRGIGDETYNTISLLLDSEHTRRQLEPLPFLLAAGLPKVEYHLISQMRNQK